MAVTVNVHEAKTHLSRLLNRVSVGEEIVIARAGKPVAALVPLGVAKRDRKPGSAAGKVKLGKDFDAPLPGGLLKLFSR